MLVASLCSPARKAEPGSVAKRKTAKLAGNFAAKINVLMDDLARAAISGHAV